MSLKEKVTKLAETGSDKKLANVPPEWRARLDLGSEGGFFISTPRTAGELPDAVELFKDFDLDPNVWTVISVRKSRWQRYDGEWLEAARVSIKPSMQVRTENNLDIEKLISEVSKWRPSKSTKPSVGDLSVIFAVGDSQYGKDAGDGTDGTIRRVLASIEQSVLRHKELTKTGRKLGTVCLPQLGDCIEGSVSQHGKVLGRSDLTITQQVRLGRRMLMSQIKAMVALSENLIVPVVPGNHDEAHRIVLTDPMDSWQVEVVSAVQDACMENPTLSHIQFRYPEADNSSLAIDLGGVTLGMAHGHQARDMEKWWQGQATGRTPVGSADILLTGHFHHYKVHQVGPRLWVQTPAMDGGSPWFRNSKGLESPSGIVSLVVGKGYDPRRDLCVLGGEDRVV